MFLIIKIISIFIQEKLKEKNYFEVKQTFIIIGNIIL